MAVRVMGVLNVTPDSFSDGGSFMGFDDAIAHARVMIDEGVDIIDVGGESSRPGAAPVSETVECERVLPVIEALTGSVRISIDTRHPEVARVAVGAGASIINDISASLWPVAAELGVGWIAMHMQGEPATMQGSPSYDDPVDEVYAFLDERASQAAEAGVSEIWVDPGFGFGKNLVHNVALLAHLDRLVATGWPVAVGTSRKSMLGQLLARSDGVDTPVSVDDRLVGSVVTATYAMVCGADLVRVHDVRAVRQAATVFAGEKYIRRT